MRPKDLWIEEQLALQTEPRDPHADCTDPERACPECLAGYHRDMAELAQAERAAS